jgi:tellurite resistance protein TehA-like permease
VTSLTATSHGNRLRNRVVLAASTANPGYFALVMGTGIVSVGMANHHQAALSSVLLWFALVAYAILVAVNVGRIVAFRGLLASDFTDPRRAFGFFTFVAGTDVLGTRLALAGWRGLALTLLVVGSVSWLVLGYVVPWTAVLGRNVRPVVAAANGTWFIWVVASQSIAVLAAVLEPETQGGRRELALLAVFCWSVGVFLYAAVGIFVAARLMLYPLDPADLTPPYWVAMGATAITVLAGARIVQMADAPMVAATRGLIAGASVVFWAFGTWLIPALVAAGWWRHTVHRIPLRYEAAWWSIVFPLGMYGVAGHYIGRADNLPIVRTIGENETWLALAVWAAALIAMLAHLSRTVLRGSRPAVAEPL